MIQILHIQNVKESKMKRGRQEWKEEETEIIKIIAQKIMKFFLMINYSMMNTNLIIKDL